MYIKYQSIENKPVCVDYLFLKKCRATCCLYSDQWHAGKTCTQCPQIALASAIFLPQAFLKINLAIRVQCEHTRISGLSTNYLTCTYSIFLVKHFHHFKTKRQL